MKWGAFSLLTNNDKQRKQLTVAESLLLGHPTIVLCFTAEPFIASRPLIVYTAERRTVKSIPVIGF